METYIIEVSEDNYLNVFTFIEIINKFDTLI